MNGDQKAETPAVAPATQPAQAAKPEKKPTPPPSPAEENLLEKIVEQTNLDMSFANLMIQTQFDKLWRIATVIARGSLCPKHLCGANLDETSANCFRVVEIALRWGMSPFSLVDESFVVGGKLAFQAKVYAAVVNRLAPLRERLRAEFTGTAENKETLSCTVTGHFKNEEKPRTVTHTWKQGKDMSSNQKYIADTLWYRDPVQKLLYSTILKWARAHCPEIVLGMMSEEETPTVSFSQMEPDVAKPKISPEELFKSLRDRIDACKIAGDPYNDGVFRDIEAAIAILKSGQFEDLQERFKAKMDELFKDPKKEELY